MARSTHNSRQQPLGALSVNQQPPSQSPSTSALTSPQKSLSGRRRGTQQKYLNPALMSPVKASILHRLQRQKTPPPVSAAAAAENQGNVSPGSVANGVDGFMFTSPLRSSKKTPAIMDKSAASSVARKLFTASGEVAQKSSPASPSKRRSASKPVTPLLAPAPSQEAVKSQTLLGAAEKPAQSSVNNGQPVDSMLFSPYPCTPKHKYFTRSQVVHSDHRIEIVSDEQTHKQMQVDKYDTVIREENAVGHRDIHIHREHTETLPAHTVVSDEVTVSSKYTPESRDEIDISDLETEEALDSFLLIHKLNRISGNPSLHAPEPFVKKALPPKDPNDHRLTLVLDLDETLVHCSTDASKIPQPDLDFTVAFQNRLFNVFVSKRPRVMEFLHAVSQHFEVVIFTASQQIYADKLLDLLDPERVYTRYRLFRDSCVPVDGTFVKDLRVLGRDLSKVIIIDNAVEAFSYQIDNGIPIKSWFCEEGDQELVKVFNFLIAMDQSQDIRGHLRQKFQLNERIARAHSWFLQHV